MTDKNDYTPDSPYEVFSGTAWEVGLIKSLLDNAEIEAFIMYGGDGAVVPWDAKGGLPVNRVFVAQRDYDNAKEVIRQYYEAMKEQPGRESEKS